WSSSKTSSVIGASDGPTLNVRVKAVADPASRKPGISRTGTDPTVYERTTLSPSTKSPLYRPQSPGSGPRPWGRGSLKLSPFAHPGPTFVANLTGAPGRVGKRPLDVARWVKLRSRKPPVQAPAIRRR